jgi:hypothetical protein
MQNILSDNLYSEVYKDIKEHQKKLGTKSGQMDKLALTLQGKGSIQAKEFMRRTLELVRMALGNLKYNNTQKKTNS